MEKKQGAHTNWGILFIAVFGLAMGAGVAKGASSPIYDEHAGARREINAAISQASKTGRNIVLIFSANW